MEVICNIESLFFVFILTTLQNFCVFFNKKREVQCKKKAMYSSLLYY